MYAVVMRPVMLFVLALTACSSKDSASSKPSGDQPAAPAAPPLTAGGKVLTDDQVCDALTPDEIEAELHVKTVARKLPKPDKSSAPSCGWFAADAPETPDAREIVGVTMFIHDKAADAKEYFNDKLDDMCRLLTTPSTGSAGSGSAGSGSAGSGSAGSGSGSDSLTGPARGRALIGPNLGEDAAVCGSLWVLKGQTFFGLRVRIPTATREQRVQSYRHLAERVLAHLP
jgi:hypothetical protein